MHQHVWILRVHPLSAPAITGARMDQKRLRAINVVEGSANGDLLGVTGKGQEEGLYDVRPASPRLTGRDYRTSLSSVRQV